MINNPILLSQFINTTNKKTMKTTMIKKALLSAMMLMSYASVQASGLDSTMIIPLKPVGQGGPHTTSQHVLQIV